MQRWLAAIGGSLVAILIVVACTGHAPQTPTPVARSGSGEENGLVRAQETPEPPVFPSIGPTPQTFPSTGPTPQTFPSIGPTPQTFPSTGPTPQTFPTTGPTPQTYPSTNAPQATPTPGPTPSGGPTPTPSPSGTPNPVVTTIVSVASGRPYQVVHNGMVSGAKVYIDRPEFIVTGVFGPETGFELIRTAFADGTATEDRFLVLHVNRRVGVIVMMPGRDPLPSWFNSCPSGSPPIGCWEHTGRGFELENSNDPDFFDVPTHRVQVFEPGTITLGPRRATTTSVPQMYWVAVYPCEADFSDCPPPIAARFRPEN